MLSWYFTNFPFDNHAGKSKEKRGLNSREEGNKMTGDPRGQPATQENVGASEDSCKFILKHPFFQIVLAHAYVHSGFLVKFFNPVRLFDINANS